VYGVLRGYYRQDPAAWFARPAGAAPGGEGAGARPRRGSRRRARARKG
jgi:hypothetical protein